MNTSQLENPIWNSLRTDHARLAEGDDCARRYPHEIGPLAGIPDQSDASYNSLRTLAGDHAIALFSLDSINPRGSWTTIRTGRVIQMVRTLTASTNPVPTPDHKPVTMPPDTSTTNPAPPAPSTTTPTAPSTTTPSGFVGTVTASTNPVPTPDHKPVTMPPDTSTTNPLPPAPSTTAPTAPSTKAPSSFSGGSISPHNPALDLDPGCTFRRLTAADAPAMVALAELTEPGPFRLRTIELGNFYGIFHGDQLVSMAGKRMHFPGFIEVSGVCTHPDYRGRGYAGALIQVIINEIEATGRTPFLHAWEGNPAQYLYESLGFTLTRTFNLSALAAA